MDEVVDVDVLRLVDVVRRLVVMLEAVYGVPIARVVESLSQACAVRDPTTLRLIYLVCLDDEPSLQRFERARHADKMDVFLPLLRRATEDYFQCELDDHEYVVRCCNAYVLA